MGVVLSKTKPDSITDLEEAIELIGRCHVVDYTYFEGNYTYRLQQRDEFIAGNVYVPVYDYPYLNKLGRIERTQDRIKQALGIIADNIEEIGWDKAELYLGSLIFNLKRAQIISASSAMLNAKRGGDYEQAKQRFQALNSQLYGDIALDQFFNVAHRELKRAANFSPATKLAHDIKDEIHQQLSFASKHAGEEQLMPKPLYNYYRDKVQLMYGNIMDVVPDGERFDAEASVAYINKALETGGLHAYGWQAMIDASKTSPATHGQEKRIYLPAGTLRTSAQLRGLILHEQEVHARRFENGSHFRQFPLLAFGTAEFLPVEEGLGTVMALLAAPEDTTPLQRARLRYLSVGLAQGADGVVRDARQVYEIIWRLIALTNAHNGYIDQSAAHRAKLEAYAYIENIFRGTNFAEPGVVYAKAKVYYEGLIKTTQYLQKIQGDNGAFVRMFIGKYNHTNVTETAHIMRIIKPT